MKPQPCVATIGFFDGVHQGHRFLIEQVRRLAAEEGLESAVITFPVHPRQVMQPDCHLALLSTSEEKRALLRATGIDRIIELPFTRELSQYTAREFMGEVLQKRLQVHTLVIGYDHRFGHNRSEGFEDYCRYGREMGMRVVHAPACVVDGVTVSSSAIRRFLLGGEVTMANRCLGYEYYLEGTVIHGFQVGRTLGFPTANLSVEEPGKLIPVNGVYAVRVTLDADGSSYSGMLNIGVRPTVGNGTQRSIEVHLLRFAGNLYGRKIRVSFVQRIRNEQKFSGLDALVAQLRTDACEVERLMLSDGASFPL